MSRSRCVSIAADLVPLFRCAAQKKVRPRLRIHGDPLALRGPHSLTAFWSLRVALRVARATSTSSDIERRRRHRPPRGASCCAGHDRQHRPAWCVAKGMLGRPARAASVRCLSWLPRRQRGERGLVEAHARALGVSRHAVGDAVVTDTAFVLSLARLLARDNPRIACVRGCGHQRHGGEEDTQHRVKARGGEGSTWLRGATRGVVGRWAGSSRIASEDAVGRGVSDTTETFFFLKYR